MVIASGGVGPVYAMEAASCLVLMAALLIMRPAAVTGKIPRVGLRAALEGLSFVRQSPILLGTALVDFVATFFGSATALLPIFARDILRVGSAGYGLLYAAPSVGAIAAAALLSVRAREVHRQGLVIFSAVAVYGLCTLVFGLSRLFALSLIALAGAGAADSLSTIIRQTLRQTITPDALQGRMTSVTMVFFAGGPQLGELEAGVMARVLGAPLSVISGGIAAMLSVGLIAALFPALRRYGQATRA